MQNIQVNKSQQGFTLIELMIVVAIIGILAAIAIPQYQDYVARSQASEALTLLGGAKTPVEEYVLTKGSFPASSVNLASELGINTSGTYVSSITATPVGNNGGGQLKATFKNSANADISSVLSGKEISLYREVDSNGIVTWSCRSSDIDEKYLPSGCTKS